MSSSDPSRDSVAVSADQAARLMRRAAIASVSVATVLILAKAVGVILTGSLALLSSLVDSALDAVASVVNLLAVNRSLTPPDAEHRFGHGKAEALAALGQGALVIGSGLFLIAEALGRLIDPAEISAGTAGIGIMVLSMVLTGVLVLYQLHVVRRTNSLTIAADSLHYRTDFLINAAVIVSLALSTFAGWKLADPVLALAIAAYILFSAWEIGGSAVSQLMDRELPDEQRQRIRQIVLDHPDVLDLHDMRTRTSGQQIFIELHIELDGRMSLYRSHVIAETVMADIGVEFPGTQVLVHQDPAGVEEPMTDYSRT